MAEKAGPYEITVYKEILDPDTGMTAQVYCTGSGNTPKEAKDRAIEMLLYEMANPGWGGGR